jgi:addiction module HigA family antidote
MSKKTKKAPAGIDWTRFESPLPHPGEVLFEMYMTPLGLTAGALAKLMGLSGRQRVERIVRGQQAITADTALRLGRVLDTGPELWANMQAAHDMSKAAIEGRTALARIAKYEAA